MEKKKECYQKECMSEEEGVLPKRVHVSIRNPG
jgi:hypothetical protein